MRAIAVRLGRLEDQVMPARGRSARCRMRNEGIGCFRPLYPGKRNWLAGGGDARV
jgi:hypothetical protein